MLTTSVDQQNDTELHGSLLNDERKKTNKIGSQSTITRVVVLGLNSSLIAVHMIGNGLILTSLGPEDEAAAGLITTYQSLISGAAFGFLLYTGVALSNILGKNANNTRQGYSQLPSDDIEAQTEMSDAHQALRASDETHQAVNKELSEIIRTSYVVGAGLSVMAAGCSIGLRFLLPTIVDHHTGLEAGKFFEMFAIGGFSEFMGGNIGLIITQIEKNVWLTLLTTVLYRLPAVALGEYFAVTLGMGAMGVGLGTSVAGIAAFCFSQALLLRQPYQGLELAECVIDNFYQRLVGFFNNGMKLALQRITEWGNVAAIATVIGAQSNTALQALQPSIQINSFIGLALQGMGQSAMMFFGEDCKRKEAFLENYYQSMDADDLENYLAMVKTSQKVFIKNNMAALFMTGLLSLAIYFSRQPLLNLFLGDSAEEGVYTQAEQFLYYAIGGFFPDAVRIVSGGLLRGWGDLLYPTLISLLFMTLISVPVSYGLHQSVEKDFSVYLWVRIIAIALSALVNTQRFYHHVSNDYQLYGNAKHFPDVLNAIAHHPVFSLLAAEVDGGISEQQLKQDIAKYMVNHCEQLLSEDTGFENLIRLLSSSEESKRLLKESFEALFDLSPERIAILLDQSQLKTVSPAKVPGTLHALNGVNDVVIQQNKQLDVRKVS